MDAGTDFSPPYRVSETSYNKDNVSAKEDEASYNLTKTIQMTHRKPPRHLSVMRHSVGSKLEVGIVANKSPSDEKLMFLPVFRSGSCAERGPKQYMEDEHIRIDNLIEHLDDTSTDLPSPGAFYGVFDGHGGIDAASFIRNDILRTLIIANAGDCRAVLGRRGKAIEMSNYHKPNCIFEKQRIEKLGGVICDGYLNGQLSVARALGNWHMKGSKGSACPLSAEPESRETDLSEDDEFIIMGCYGLWDVMSSQCAVTMARKELMLHNDPERCSRELVREALKRNTCDNLAVIAVCFSLDPPRRIEIRLSRVRRSISAEGLNLLKDFLECSSL